MSLLASVILCTHNPRPDYLTEVFDGLRAQTLPHEDWELLLVDNASDAPLAERWPLAWHPNARHLRVEELGLTPARLAGIEAAAAPILVFVDDDVVLDAEYLKIALEIAKDWPTLGAWGSGWSDGRFECEPPEWARPHLHCLLIFRIERDLWSNQVNQYGTAPAGAGLCVRAGVAREYRSRVLGDPRRQQLDRRGTQLLSAGDIDLGYTACDLGLGMGRFLSLKFTHLIPARRLTIAYFERLFEGNAYSDVVLRSLRGETPPASRSPGLARRLLGWYRARRLSPEERLLQAASRRGSLRAARDILQIGSEAC